jgi:hypothetical protein
MAKKKSDEEVKQVFNEVTMLLEGMLKDRSVPRNIKRVAQKGISELEKEESPGIIASNVMYLVSDLSQDANCPFHTRTVLYRVISLLEKIRDD